MLVLSKQYYHLYFPHQTSMLLKLCIKISSSWSWYYFYMLSVDIYIPLFSFSTLLFSQYLEKKILVLGGSFLGSELSI